MGESVFAALEREPIDPHRLASRAKAKVAVLRLVEGFHNPSRRRSSIGSRSPARLEAAHQPAHAQTAMTPPANRPPKRVTSIVPEEFLQPHRDAESAKRLLRGLFKGAGRALARIVTDKLRSYAAAKRAVAPGLEHRAHKGAEQTRREQRPVVPGP